MHNPIHREVPRETSCFYRMLFFITLLAPLTMLNMKSVGLLVSEKRVFLRSSFRIYSLYGLLSEEQTTKATFCSWMSGNKSEGPEQRWKIPGISVLQTNKRPTNKAEIIFNFGLSVCPRPGPVPPDSAFYPRLGTPLIQSLTVSRQAIVVWRRLLPLLGLSREQRLFHCCKTEW